MKKWYAVHTRPLWEKKVAATLKKKSFLHYLPLVLSTDFVANDNGKKEQSLFPGCVFVKLTALQHEEINRTSGVLGFWHWLDQPAVFADTDIELIAQFLQAHSTVQRSKVAVRPAPAFLLESATVTEKANRLVLPRLGWALSAVQILNGRMDRPLFRQTKVSVNEQVERHGFGQDLPLVLK